MQSCKTVQAAERQEHTSTAYSCGLGNGDKSVSGLLEAQYSIGSGLSLSYLIKDLKS